MTRTERDALLAAAAERYVGLLRLQRYFLDRDALVASERYAAPLDETVEEMLRLVDAQITPEELSKQEP